MAVAIAGAAIGTAKLVAGLIKQHKAKKEAEELAKQRPDYVVNPNVKNEVSLAESELSNGMSAEAQKAYEQGMDRDLSTTLDALLQGGGSQNNIAQTFDSSTVGRQKLALMKDNIRLNQINNLVGAYRNQTNETDKAFQFNEIAPWMDKTQANAAARKDAANLTWSGIDTIGSAGLGYLGNIQQGKMYDKYLGAVGGNKNNQTIAPPPSNNEPYSFERLLPNAFSTTG